MTSSFPASQASCRVSFPHAGCSYAEVAWILLTLISPNCAWKGKTYRHALSCLSHLVQFVKRWQISRAEFLMTNFRCGKRTSLFCVYVLRKTWNSVFSPRSRGVTAKKSTKKHVARARFANLNPLLFRPFSLPSPSSLRKPLIMQPCRPNSPLDPVIIM